MTALVRDQAAIDASVARTEALVSRVATAGGDRLAFAAAFLASSRKPAVQAELSAALDAAERALS